MDALGYNMDRDFDGLKGDVIFCSWNGNNPLSPQRAEALLSIYKETACPVLLVTSYNIGQWQLESSPFHPAFQHLSATQRGDYIRCYFMHHFGGGYTDLKPTRASWRKSFERVRQEGALGLGYQEIGPNGVARCGEPLESELRANYDKLIGNCAFIFRKNSEFTRAWFEQTHHVLDSKLAELRENPAQHPMDHKGVILPDGSISNYPFRWTEVAGDIFHPLVYQFRDRILQDNIAPHFFNYR
jgi:hypothetical protein